MIYVHMIYNMYIGEPQLNNTMLTMSISTNPDDKAKPRITTWHLEAVQGWERSAGHLLVNEGVWKALRGGFVHHAVLL